MLKQYIPPIALNYLTSIFYGWRGNYKTWNDAKKKCTGYDQQLILDKVKASLLKVKNEEAIFERDSVLFNKVYYSYPLLSALSIIALKNKEKLNVLDFGGSLGSSYYQNKKFFSNLREFNWCIVEQPHFVKEGLDHFSNQHLHFFYDIDTCLKEYSIDVLLLSSVVQYLENPYSFLNDILKKNIKYILIDRTPIQFSGKDIITIQRVPKNIYKASYPCWVFNEQYILTVLSKEYNLVFETECDERINMNNSYFKAYFFEKKD